MTCKKCEIVPIAKACWRRFFHCLFTLHRSLDVYECGYGDDGKIIRIGCSCGKVFWERK